MRRQLLLAALGAVAGGTLVYGAYRFREMPPALPSPVAAEASANAARTPAEAGATVSATRLVAYERAAAMPDRAAVEAAVAAAAAAPASYATRNALAALLARLTEMDAAPAARLAAKLDLGHRFAAPVYRAWAAADPDAALAEIGHFDSSADRQALALAVLAALGNDDANLARVADALPEIERFSFEVEAYALRAENDLAGTLADLAAAGKGELLVSVFYKRIGQAAAHRDPRAVLAMSETIGHREGNRLFRVGVFETWGETDPAGLLAYLESAPPRSVPNIAGTIRTIVAGDPEEVLGRLERYPSTYRRALQSAALRALAETDPQAALARLGDLPRGSDRDALVGTVAETLGRQDPTAAIAWAAALQPPSQQAVNGAIAGMAAVDLNRAIDWIVREIENPTVTGVNALEAFSPTVVFLGVRAPGFDVARAAERLLATGNATLEQRAASMVFAWAQTNGTAAIDFALGHLDSFEPTEITPLARQVASLDPDLAVRTIDRLPATHRVTWIPGVAEVLARSAPDRALSFLAAQRGQPGYEQTVGAVVNQLATTHPSAAAELIDTVAWSAEIRPAALALGTAWAQAEPQAAAAWAVRLERPGPIGAVATGWARVDEGAAERWARTLPSGALRDAAVNPILNATAERGEPNFTLLDALSTDAVRQQSASRVILAVGRTDQARARTLMDTYLTDTAVRQRTEQQLAQLARPGAAGAGGGMPIPFIDLEALQEAFGQ